MLNASNIFSICILVQSLFPFNFLLNVTGFIPNFDARMPSVP